MKILIPGGHGFIGKNLVEVLKNSDHEIFPLSRRDGFDLRDYTLTKRYLEKIKPDVIINCAAHVGSLHYITEYAADVVDDNMQMILNLYRAIKDICPNAKVINPISNCSYPGNADIQIESEWRSGPVHKSVWSFGNTRRMWVVVSECYAWQYKIKTINFLVPNAYGPGDSTDPSKIHALDGIIVRMLKAKKQRNPEFEIWGTGKPIREWIYVKDLARILARAISQKEAQLSPINIAQNKAYSIRETAEIIKNLVGYEGKIVFNTKYQDGDPIKKLDDKLFKNKYPNFVFTDINKGLKETINYYKKLI
jgi:GDP-L-fucose synthase